MDTRTDIPVPDSNAITPDGRFREVWWRFFLTLWNRTGQGGGGDYTLLLEMVLDLQAAVDGQQYGNAMAQIQAALDQGQMPADVAQMAAMGVIGCMASEALQRCESLAPTRGPLERFPMTEALQQIRGDWLPPDAAGHKPPAALPPDIWAHGIHQDPTLHALATTTAAGFMSPADKTKLDSL